uniref:KIB1-4 beta-propeller domain-containing protein n=1 Tax=Aegilops tauschii TaxID=37682 RepID=N1R4S0_AEGTA
MWSNHSCQVWLITVAMCDYLVVRHADAALPHHGRTSRRRLRGSSSFRLSSYADRLSFRAVCHQWRIAAQQQRPVLPPALPWLHQRMDTYQSLPDGKVHRFAVPRAPCNSSGRDAFDGMLCNFGSWVLYEHHHDEDHTYRRRCLLRNPFSGATIHIPWRSIDGRERPLMEFIFKLIVCSSELVAALVFAPSGVAFFRPGAGFSWSFSPADDSYTTYKDIAFFHGNLYALNGRGGLFLHHHDSGGQVEHVIKTPPPATKFSELPDDCRSFIQHLVVSSSSGKLLMVRWGIDPPNYGVKKTAIDHGIRLDVFEADFEKKQWSEVKDLGDQVPSPCGDPRYGLVLDELEDVEGGRARRGVGVEFFRNTLQFLSFQRTQQTSMSTLTQELGHVHGSSKMFTIRLKFPSDVVLDILKEQHLLQLDPKAHKLNNVIDCDISGRVDLVHPSMVPQCIPHQPLLPLGGHINEWGDILRPLPLQPRRFLELCLATITNGNNSRS